MEAGIADHVWSIEEIVWITEVTCRKEAQATCPRRNRLWTGIRTPRTRWLGFFEGDELKRVPVASGVAIPICSFAGLPRGASWAEDGTIVFATNDPTAKTGLLRVSADGGAPIAITALDAAHGEVGHWFPSILAGRNAVLFTVS